MLPISSIIHLLDTNHPQVVKLVFFIRYDFYLYALQSCVASLGSINEKLKILEDKLNVRLALDK